MSIRNLEQFFRARSVAVIGASNRPHSIGATIMHNLLGGGFAGPVYPVNPRHATIAGVPAWPDVAALPATPDLAIVCAPPAAIPDIIAALGARGTRAAIVISAGLARVTLPCGRTAAQAALDAARPYLLRIVGPNCLGMLVPGIGLNASFAHAHARPGRLAFVSQSGALATAILDWGNTRGIGFSCFISIGDSLDVDLGDLLDYLGRDTDTSAILLYVESIRAARKFMSAARAAARVKPVIAVKTGRVEASARAAASHTGALAGNDEIVDAVLRRAGILRVDTTQDLFDAAETLARSKPYLGPRLAIMTNGGGAGVLATDALVRGGGELAALSDATLAALDAKLPATWSRANPLDIIGDAPVARYVQTLDVLCEAPEVDAILFMHAPTAIVPSLDIARAIVPRIRGAGRNVFTCFLGGTTVEPARALLAEAGIPGYATPEEAVRAILQTVDHARLQAALLETPPRDAADGGYDLTRARDILRGVLAGGRTLATEVEAKAVLTAAGIPVVRTEIARDAADAVARATAIGFPVALKILSPDISHKTDVGGVVLNLADAADVGSAARQMQQRVALAVPDARLTGFTVQAMAPMRHAHELILGCVQDPVFGPVLMFGQGGTAVEIVRDRGFALPPLNRPLARALVAGTRVAALLRGYRDRPAIAFDALYQALERLSALVCACPEIVELDINPLLADAAGVLALDARIALAHAAADPSARLVIRPYPAELEEAREVAGRTLRLRPIRPEDEVLHARFLRSLAPEDVYFRFFQTVRDWTHPQLARLTQIDYDREMAFVAVTDGGVEPEILGVARSIADPDNMAAEFAVVVRSDRQGEGIGSVLMDKLVRHARARGTGRLVGYVLAANAAMLGLARELGFQVEGRDETGVLTLVLNLQPEAGSRVSSG
ncbi:MAG: GNAT family N-acetyltransferase [Gammaproteobacteria bacterium]